MMLGINKQFRCFQVPDLPRHAEKDYDDQGVLAPLLQRLHNHRFEVRQQGVPDLPQEARLEAVSATGSQL